ncbi:MAG: sulfotransferase, partial [Pseudomonadota bacterium]
DTAPSGSDPFCEAWAEIAGLCDKDGDYDGAIAAIEKCKSAQMETADREWSQAQQAYARYHQFLQEVNVGHFAALRARAESLEVERVGVLAGFPRTGTTLLEQMLDAHPDLYSVEEIGVFSREINGLARNEKPANTPVLNILNGLNEMRVRQLRYRYREVMGWMSGQAHDNRMMLDKNPASTRMIPLMAAVFPEMRYLIALRDPRDVILSCYLRYMPVNPVSVCFLTLERTANRFGFDMSLWQQIRPMLGDNWCEIRYEDTVADSTRQARRACATLGLEWDDAVVNYREKLDTKRINSPTYEAVQQPVYSTSVGRWQHYQRHLEPYFDLLGPLMQEMGYS